MFGVKLGDLASKFKDADKVLGSGNVRDGVKLMLKVSQGVHELMAEGGVTEEALEKLDEMVKDSLIKAMEELKMNQPTLRRMPLDANSWILPSDETIFLGDIVGMEKAKIALTEAIILPTIEKLIPNQHKLRAILFYGATGVGKTRIIKAFCNSVAETFDIKVSFLNIGLDSVLGSHHGETEKNLTDIFNAAAQLPSPILCFDEVDSIASDRSKPGRNGEANISNHFLTLLDGLATTSNIVVIGTTNRPANMDIAYFRRFESMVYFELPNMEQRECMLRALLFQIQNPQVCWEIDFKSLASSTDRYSPADLRILVGKAFHEVRTRKLSKEVVQQMEFKRKCDFADFLTADTFRHISHDDLVFALSSTSPTNDKDIVSELEKFAKQFGGKEEKYEILRGDCECGSFSELHKNPCNWLFDVLCIGTNFVLGE